MSGVVQGKVLLWRLGRKDIITHVERGRGRSASLDCHPCVASQHRDFNRVKQIYHCLVEKGWAHNTKQEIWRKRNGIEEGMVDEACMGVVMWVGGHGVLTFWQRLASSAFLFLSFSFCAAFALRLAMVCVVSVVMWAV